MAGKSLFTDQATPHDFNHQPPPSRYDIDLEKVRQVWQCRADSLLDLFCTRNTFHGAQPVIAPTHTLGLAEPDIRLIAFDNPGAEDPEADESEQPDIARFIAPGEFAVVIRYRYRNNSRDPLDEIKLRCFHSQVAIGVERNGKAGVISLANPQRFFRKRNKRRTPHGLFGAPAHVLIFLKPVFPGKLDALEIRRYVDNITAWTAIANTFSVFPNRERFNGKDPLATIDLEKVATLGDRLLEALLGEEAAFKWLNSPENRVYCGELIHLGLNLGLYHPLSRAHLGEEKYAAVKSRLAGPGALSENPNHYIRQMKLALAADELKPIDRACDFSGEHISPEPYFDARLAVQPFTLADMLEVFVQMTVPREEMGEKVAPLQVQLLEKIKPEFFKAAGNGEMPPDDPNRAQIELFYQKLISVVGREYGDYQGFIARVAPFLRAAREFPEQFKALNAFMPPHCFLARAQEYLQGKPRQGILGWQYLGHGLHRKLLKPRE